MDLSAYDQIITSLVGIATRMDLALRRQEEYNADITAFLQQQQAVNTAQALVNTQNTTLIMRLARTLDRLDEKLDRIFPAPTSQEGGVR